VTFVAGGLLLLAAGFPTDSRAGDEDKGLKLGGSIRGRYEWMKFRNDATGSGDVKDTRGRLRYRFRLDGKAKINPKAGIYFRLGTGTDNRSGNQTLGGGADFAPDALSIRHAALVYTPWDGGKLPNEKGHWKFDFGRVKNPFIWKGGGKDKMLWDSDISFAGVSTVFDHKLGDSSTIFANTGYFVIDENSSGENDPFLAPVQLGIKFGGDKTKFGVRGTYYYMGELDDDFVQRGVDGTGGSTKSGGNVSDGLTGSADGGIIRVAETQACIATELGSLPVTLYGGYSNNTSATASEIHVGVDANGVAYNFGLEGGSKKKFLVGVAGYHAEANAFPSQFIDSDVLDGYTNREGLLIYLARTIMKNTDFNLQLYFSDAIDKHEELVESVENSKRTRLQVDMTYKF
jgi:hypothetical protein